MSLIIFVMVMVGVFGTSMDPDTCVIDNECADIHVIDMSLYDTNFEYISTRIVQSLKRDGFMILHNVNQFNSTELYQIVTRFFYLSKNDKNKYLKCGWNSNNTNCYRGYYPIIPGQSSYKEAIEYGRHINKTVIINNESYIVSSLNEYPIYPDITVDEQKWELIFNKYYELFHDLSIKILDAINYGLHTNSSNKNLKTFSEMFKPNPLSTFRLIHSPPHPQYSGTDREEYNLTSTPEHVDSGFITFVVPFQRGLEIYDINKQKWLKLSETHNVMYLNIGALLRKLTNNTLKATRHRVINYNENRYSTAFFAEPDYNAIINTDNTPLTYGPWVEKSVKKFIEYSGKPMGSCYYINNAIECWHPDGTQTDFA